MKKKGRGRGYKKALFRNLVKSLVAHKKIITTKAKAKKLRSEFLKEHGGILRMVVLGERRGDRAPEILLEWDGKNAKDKTDKKKGHKKKMASN